ncbi:FAD dependent oxidoreductase [Heliocybe sulcata]|uniref:FAD dependent oxidoreductase n=1 Tax=Heliocybe sulcata TaxID=5364 RepID=A0A5C3N3D5_9AGAM|nr:FAD dependent oxidoreductase [Heliocybe sulcata]
MPTVTIVGAGVFGLTTALSLPRHYAVTIVARDMPGDADSLDWASPWAGAGFGGGGTKDQDPEEIEMLKAGFRYFWKLAQTNPESSVKRMPGVHYRDNIDTDEDLWIKDFMPNYRVMDKSQLPTESNAKIGLSYMQVVMTPSTYMLYLFSLLKQSSNVTFVRATIQSLTELLSSPVQFGPAPDVIINASGVGARTLHPLEDELVEPIRGQTIIIRHPGIDHRSGRSGNDYCYVIPRGDGTVVIGGVKQPGNTDPSVDADIRVDIARRAHQLDPRIPANVEELDIVRDVVGIRPGRRGGMRVEAERVVIGNVEMPVVHAYGASGTGFAFSPGVGRKVAQLVDDFVMGDKCMLDA